MVDYYHDHIKMITFQFLLMTTVEQNYWTLYSTRSGISDDSINNNQNNIALILDKSSGDQSNNPASNFFTRNLKTTVRHHNVKRFSSHDI